MYYVYRFYYRLMYFLLWDLVSHIVWSLASSNNIYACTVWHYIVIGQFFFFVLNIYRLLSLSMLLSMELS